MDKTLTADLDLDFNGMKAKDYKVVIAKMFDELKQLDEQTSSSQARTERLQLETREILDRLKAMHNVA